MTGCGFVEFETRESAENLMETYNQKFSFPGVSWSRKTRIYWYNYFLNTINFVHAKLRRLTRPQRSIGRITTDQTHSNSSLLPSQLLTRRLMWVQEGEGVLQVYYAPVACWTPSLENQRLLFVSRRFLDCISGFDDAKGRVLLIGPAFFFFLWCVQREKNEDAVGPGLAYS